MSCEPDGPTTPYEPDGPTTPYIPPEVLRDLSSHLDWSDVLAARATCSYFAEALAPLIKQLRVPLTAAVPRCSTPPPAAAAAAAAEDDDDDVNNTRAVAEIQPPEQQLAAALPRLVNVSSITLVLTAATTAQDLQQALQLIASKDNIATVTLCEVGKPPGKDEKPRGYVSELSNLHQLVHVVDLRVVSLSWTLASIWKQVGALHAASTSTTSTSASLPGSRSSSSTSSSAPVVSSCALRRLTIEQVPDSRLNKLHCSTKDLQAAPLPAQITHLTAPLPGQFNEAGEVVCQLNRAHEEYVSQLAAGLPGLRCLSVAGAFEGRDEAFEGFRNLLELTCEVGSAFRAGPLGDPDRADEYIPSLRLATRVGAGLQRLQLLSRRPEQTMQRLRPMEILLQHPSSATGHDPFELRWLRHNTHLQHLAVPLMASGQQQDFEGASSQLRSLMGHCLLPTSGLFSEIFAVGAQLTTLGLFQTGPDLSPIARLYSFRVGRMIQVPQPPRPLAHLQSLTLLADSRTVYILPDPAAFWAQLPALSSVRFQGVALGHQANGKLSADRVVTVAGKAVGRAQALPSGLEIVRLVLWLKDLPCRQLQQLELCNYAVVLEPTTKEHTANNNNTNHSSSSSEDDNDALPALQHLKLVDCGFLALLAQPTSSTTGGSSSSSNTRRAAVHASVQQLLSRLVDPCANGSRNSSSLLRLQLIRMTVGLTDMVAICTSLLGDKLRELQVETDDWHDGTEGPGGGNSSSSNSSGQQQQQPSGRNLAEVLAAAVRAGKLQQLRRLSLLLTKSSRTNSDTAPAEGFLVFGGSSSGIMCSDSETSAIGASVLAACSRLRSLQRLHLLLDADADRDIPWGPVWCSCSSVQAVDRKPVVLLPAFEGPWQAVLQLQHLRVLDVKLHCSGSRPLHAQQQQQQQQPAQGVAVLAVKNNSKSAVVGACEKCGGAVSARSLHLWLGSVVAPRLPDCDIDVVVVPLHG